MRRQSRCSAKDACRILGIHVTGGRVNTTAACRKLDGDEITTVSRADFGMAPGRAVRAVSESGLYKLIGRSDKPEAREFQDWVYREVLPSIRKTGENGSFLCRANYPSLLEGGIMEGVFL